VNKKLINFIICLGLNANIGLTCTRVVYKGPDNLFITGRTMDFSIDIPANLWVFPRQMKRHGHKLFYFDVEK
jgi:choloylglycine hydrolase